MKHDALAASAATVLSVEHRASLLACHARVLERLAQGESKLLTPEQAREEAAPRKAESLP